MLKVIKELYNTSKFACIYVDINDTHKFIFGIILAVDNQKVAIQMISPYGEDDGIVVININTIIKIEIENLYVAKMQRLYCKKMPIYNLEIINNNVIDSVLLFAFREKLMVSIELLNSGHTDIVGIIFDINDIHCEIQIYDEYGNKDGKTFFLVEDITQISILSQEENAIMKLVESSNTGDGSLC